MSIGLSLLHAACEAGSVSVLRQVNEVWFLEAEMPAFLTVRNHVRTYGVMPSLDTMAEQGVSLTPSPNPVEYYITRVRDRAMYNVLSNIVEPFTEALTQRNVAEAVGLIRQAGLDAGGLAAATETSSIVDLAAGILEQYELRRVHPHMTGVPTGWDTLDRLTDGWQPADLGVIVGRPNIGKSYLLLHSVMSAWAAGHSVYVVSMEMAAEAVARRIIALDSHLGPSYIQRGMVGSLAEHRLYTSVANMADRPPLHIMAGEIRKTVGDIDNGIQETSPDIVFIDASYLLTPERGRNRGGAKWEAVSDVMEEVKSIAVRRNIPIVNTVQFNRSQKKRQRTDMDLDQIAGSDAIGQIASVVLGARNGNGAHQKTRRRISIMKNRENDLGEFVTDFQFPNMQFGEIDPQRELLTRTNRRNQI